MALKNKIGLGTVQFGLTYGINNRVGRPPIGDVERIIDLYSREEMPLYDTAILYGDSQEVLGAVFQNLGIHSPKIVSKFTDAAVNESELRKELELCLKTLRVDSLYGFIAHRPDSLIRNPGLLEHLQAFKEEGLIEKTGISAYFPEEVNHFKKGELDLIQVPFSIFDQRFQETISVFKAGGGEVHVRSLFLQGLIFKPLSFFTGYFEDFSEVMHEMNALSEKYGLSTETLSLMFGLNQENIDRVILGVDTSTNLAENLAGAASLEKLDRQLSERLVAKMARYSIEDKSKLLPYNWPKVS